MLLKPAYNTIIYEPLTFYDDRSRDIDMLVIHSSPSHSAQDLIDVFKRRGVCTHYIIDKDGAIIQCVDEKYRAWHAGASYWRKDGGPAATQDNLNANSVGIEICSPTLGQTPFTDAQLQSLKWLTASIVWRNHIKPYKIVGHSDIASARKPDPGKMLPWDQLADVGVSFWYSLNDSRQLPDISTKRALAIIGYDVRNDDVAAASAYAFLRRFIPHRVSVPQKMLDVISNVYPKDPAVQWELLHNKVTNVVARAVARCVINYQIQEKRQKKQELEQAMLNQAAAKRNFFSY